MTKEDDLDEARRSNSLLLKEVAILQNRVKELEKEEHRVNEWTKDDKGKWRHVRFVEGTCYIDGKAMG